MPTSPRTPRQRCHSEPVLTLAWESASPVPCLSLWERWPSEALTEGLSFRGRGRAPPLHTTADSLCALRAGGCGHPPLRNHRRRMRHTHGRTESSAPTHGFPAAKYFQTSGQRPPPTFAALRQRRDLIIAHTPGGCFQRGRAAALPLWSLQDGGFSRGKEDRNFLPP